MILQTRYGTSVVVKASVSHLDINCVVLISRSLTDLLLSFDYSVPHPGKTDVQCGPAD